MALVVLKDIGINRHVMNLTYDQEYLLKGLTTWVDTGPLVLVRSHSAFYEHVVLDASVFFQVF